jgi:N-acetylglutamate synthase-like GNAT family acetyltransferase
MKKPVKELTGAVRAAKMNDIEQIYKVIREHPKQVLSRSYPDLMRNFDRFLVYEENAKIKGVVSWQVLPNIEPAETPMLEIVSLSVRNRDQARGLGRELVVKMLEELDSYGRAKILVLTFYPKFFRKFGFRKVAKKKIYSKIYLGCFNCSKYPSPLKCPEVAMIRPSRKIEEENEQ